MAIKTPGVGRNAITGRFSYPLHKAALTVLLTSLSLSAEAGVKAGHRAVDPDKDDRISFGVSIGGQVSKDAAFWGWTADYSRVLSGKWSVATSIAFDRETEWFGGGLEKTVDTYTFIVVGNFAISDKWSLGGGAGKGFLSDDNAENKLEFENGDFAVGLSLGYSFSARTGLSFSLERNITQNETALSADLTWGWDF